jgi:hypothetical protein
MVMSHFKVQQSRLALFPTTTKQLQNGNLEYQISIVTDL